MGCLFEQSSVLSYIEHISGTAVAIKAISAKKLADMMIPMIPIEKQKALGELWRLSKRQKRLLQEYMFESERFLSGLVETITSSKGELA
ncbi:MAG: hypothetical protein AAGU14_09435 [Eubacteriaceae bacterium]